MQESGIQNGRNGASSSAGGFYTVEEAIDHIGKSFRPDADSQRCIKSLLCAFHLVDVLQMVHSASYSSVPLPSNYAFATGPVFDDVKLSTVAVPFVLSVSLRFVKVMDC